MALSSFTFTLLLMLRFAIGHVLPSHTDSPLIRDATLRTLVDRACNLLGIRGTCLASFYQDFSIPHQASSIW
jgi:hypothetical protein